jgi:UDP-glucose 4-epimerase
VVLLDNLSAQRHVSLFNLPVGQRFQFIEDDICTADLDPYFKGIDVVVHLAAITNAEGSFGIRDQVERTNFEGTARVAAASARAGCKMIFVSTTSVYGPQTDEVDEESKDDELKPQSPYAESKLRAEKMLEALALTEGLQFITCRFGTIFGSSVGMRFHTAVNRFIWQACTGRPLTVWRTAMHQKRPYLELGDAVRALSFIVEKSIFDNRVYNVLTTNATVSDILDVIWLYVPDAKVEYVDSPIMNQLSYTVSNRRFCELGFRFSGSLWQSIGDAVKLFDGLARPDRLPIAEAPYVNAT